MKKFIKMLSYSKEGRNIFAFCSYLRRALYKKKKNDVIWALFLTFCFSFLQNETLFEFI